MVFFSPETRPTQASACVSNQTFDFLCLQFCFVFVFFLSWIVQHMTSDVFFCPTTASSKHETAKKTQGKMHQRLCCNVISDHGTCVNRETVMWWCGRSVVSNAVAKNQACVASTHHNKIKRDQANEESEL